MKFGPNYYYKCPSCGNILATRSLMSGNTFGATFYSDGRCIARMMPDIPNLTKCEQCDTILWLSDLKKLSDSKGKSSKQMWENAENAEHLELEDLWRVLEEAEEANSPLPIEREIFVRQRIWWEYNINGFETIDDMNNWIQNNLSLLEILDTNETEQRCMAAELNRNLCNFSKCLKLIKELPEKYNNFKERLREECENGNPLTVVLNEKKKQIFKENFYDIIKNSKNEMLFCLSEHEGEPDDEPELVYDGGENALLYRCHDYIVVLDKVHEDARKLLTSKEKVLIVEMSKGENKDVVREYVADVRVENQLPDERGLEKIIPKRIKKDDLSSRFDEKIENDEKTAKNALQFYRPFAEKCNADAQYALGKLYLDERFYDMTEAVKWLQYAAFQGHKEAFAELEDLEIDDDGRHDGWS